ncbi:unnamed protein product [Clonostachys rosea f. rosea IK726]|uniref:Uncharacterized protein n=1 Tax=Clonostachys rosea f. rosea IK726 TaxID=1349383 RepID=A0ACA9TLS3_BIOOC|nr:unnamed protein product [Clonostachys rosea f. rosea IK726]
MNMSDGYNRWAIPTSIHLMFAGITLILTFFTIESPCYLIRVGKREEALKVLSKFRGLPVDHPYVIDKITAIDYSYQEEKEATLGMGWMGVVKEIFTVKRNAYRLFLTNLAQIMACWSGGSAITAYAPDLFKLTISLLFIGIFLNIVPIANNPSFKATKSQSIASKAAIAMIYISGAGWALGWNSGQYLLSSELFPLRIRAVCSSITMAMHFICQYGVNRVLPNMLLEGTGLGPQGIFYFFGIFCLVGGFWVWLCVPEAAGRSLESIDQLFDLPWYKIGLHGKKFAEEYDREQEEIY